MNVYLAQSYHSDSDLVSRTLAELYEYAVVIKQYDKSRKYCEKTELGDISAMFVIPPKIVFKENSVGKGLYSQIHYCISRDIPVFIVDNQLRFSKIVNIEIFDEYDWQMYYGTVILERFKGQISYTNLTSVLPIKRDVYKFSNF